VRAGQNNGTRPWNPIVMSYLMSYCYLLAR